MEGKLQQLLDEREIIRVVNSIGINADLRNWQAVLPAFADEVLLDYSSMGAPVETLKSDDIVRNWQAILPGFKMTQHMITNHQVSITENEADCFSYVHAIHHLPNESNNNTWLVVGHYEHHLIRLKQAWRVDKMKLIATLIDGNMNLPQMAMQAARAVG
jgi:SnoaL-like domain